MLLHAQTLPDLQIYSLKIPRTDTAICFRDTARSSLDSNMPAKSLELEHTIRLLRELTSEIDERESEIKAIMDEFNSPILSIPGISYKMGL